MPTVKLNKQVFEKLVGRKLGIEKLKDRISYLGTDLEDVKGNEIIVEVFPNRPDLLSEQGFARAFSSFIGKKTGLKHYSVKKSGEKVIIDRSVNRVRPYTACAIVKNLDFDHEKIKEIIQIQEKLHISYCRNRKKAAIGIYPFDKIKCPIKYKALKPEEIKFRPLESDKEMTAKQVLEKHQIGKAYGHLLEGLNKYPVFVDADDKILSMPPIINSHNTGKINVNTKEVFIECSGFDFEVLKKLLNILVTALADMGGTIYSISLNYPGKKYETPDLEAREMRLDLDYINKVLGLDLKEKETQKLLERMGFGFSKGKVLVPAYRADVLHQIDLVESVAIAYGYENFKEEIPEVATVAEEDKFATFKNKIADLLLGLGLLEVSTYHISNLDDQCKNMKIEDNVIRLKNNLTVEYSALRSWVVPGLIKVLGNNKHREYPQNIFDIGMVFSKNNRKETNVQEDVDLGIVLCHQKSNYTGIRQIVDALFNSLGIEYNVREDEHGSFIEGRVASVYVGKEKIAVLGEIDPYCLTKQGVEMPVSALELNLTKLFEIIK